jgi:hypothetical protein
MNRESAERAVNKIKSLLSEEGIINQGNYNSIQEQGCKIF